MWAFWGDLSWGRYKLPLHPSDQSKCPKLESPLHWWRVDRVSSKRQKVRNYTSCETKFNVSSSIRWTKCIQKMCRFCGFFGIPLVIYLWRITKQSFISFPKLISFVETILCRKFIQRWCRDNRLHEWDIVCSIQMVLWLVCLYEIPNCLYRFLLILHYRSSVA